MQKLIDSLPLLLLVGIVPYFFYSEPNIAQSVIATALAALSGYSYYLASLKKPDYVKIFTDRLDAGDKNQRKLIEEVRREMSDLKEKTVKLNITQTKEQQISNFKW